MSSLAPKHAAKAVERFVFFSDAVFAFALTLQAITLKLPPHDGPVSNTELVLALDATLPGLTCYVLTFGIVAVLWVRHHRMFEKLRDYDSRLIALNFLLLFAISLFPFVIQMTISAQDLRIPYTCYGVLAGFIGLLAFAISWYLQRTPGLVEAIASPAAYRRDIISAIALPVFVLAMIAACWTLSRHEFIIAMLGLALIATLLRLRYKSDPAPAAGN